MGKPTVQCLCRGSSRQQERDRQKGHHTRQHQMLHGGSKGRVHVRHGEVSRHPQEAVDQKKQTVHRHGQAEQGMEQRFQPLEHQTPLHRRQKLQTGGGHGGATVPTGVAATLGEGLVSPAVACQKASDTGARHQRVQLGGAAVEPIPQDPFAFGHDSSSFR